MRTPPDRSLLLFTAIMAGALALGCGPGTPTGSPGPDTPVVTAAPVKPPPPPAPAGPTAGERLQGTWEIVRYESDALIPDEAMPLMGAMFEALRIKFEGAEVVARIEKHEERVSFTAENVAGDAFTLVAREFMFDGARCRFTAEGELEITDRGGRWPGVSRLRRLP